MRVCAKESLSRFEDSRVIACVRACVRIQASQRALRANAIWAKPWHTRADTTKLVCVAMRARARLVAQAHSDAPAALRSGGRYRRANRLPAVVCARVRLVQCALHNAQRTCST